MTTQTTADFRALCAELVEVLSLNDYYDEQAGDMAYRTLLQRARAALAQPEPEGPTGEELAKTAMQAVENYRFATELPYFLSEDSSEYEPLMLILRAVLARWGNHPGSPDSSGNLKAKLTGSPVDGEVAELVAWLRETGDLACQADAEEGQRYWSAADLLERLSPPQPISVSERLPEPEDCDGWERNHPISNIWCWWWDSDEEVWTRNEADTPRPSYYTHWLPAHALTICKD